MDSDEIQKLHDAIRSGDLEIVKNFVAAHPDDYVARNSSTKKSALGVAKEANQIEIIEYLQNENFELCYTEKYKIKEEKKKNFIKPENSHIEFIASKPEFENEQDVPGKKLIVKAMLEKLDKIDKIRPILKAVECSEQLRITFDFNKRATDGMDPTTGPGTLGNCIYKYGHVYVGAMGYEVSERYQEIMGVFIHELTHHALFLVYDNDSSPYHAGDFEKMEKFERIVKTLEGRQDELDPALGTAFRYGSDCWGVELIARVPQVLAMYDISSQNLFSKLRSFFRPNKLNLARSNAEELFEFFEEVTLKDVKNFDWAKNLIRQINSEKGSLHDELSSCKIKLKVKLELDDEINEIRIIGSNAPYFSMTNLFNFFSSQFEGSCKHQVIFVSMDSLLDESGISELFLKVKNALYSKSNPVAVVYCHNTPHETVERFLSIIASFALEERIILISDTEIVEKIKKTERLKVIFETLSWTDLTEESQTRLLSKKANFQGRILELSNITSQKSTSTIVLPLQAVVDETLKISESLSLSYHSFFKERKLILNQTGREIRNFPQKKILISGPAGTGKSVIMEKIAKDLLDSHNWISIIDLKAYTDALKSLKEKHTILDFIGFMENVFKRCNNDLDREILQELYNEGRVTVLLDSFDEISPYYKEVVNVFIRNFNTGNGNQLWVATRPHLEAELESTFGFSVISLKELTREQQIEFLVELWEKSDEETKKKALNLLDQLQRLTSSKAGFIGYPQLIKMVAEIYKDQNLKPREILSYYSIYDSFWEKHLKNWKKVSEIAQVEQVEREKDPDSQNPTKIHQNIALQYLFGSDVEIDEAWTDEMILRIRIIVKNEKNYKFMHETFAEYFVASFILNSLGKKNIRSQGVQSVVDLSKKIILLDKNSLGQEHKVIRRFLNEGLEKVEVNESIRAELRVFIPKMVTEESTNFFEVITREGLEKIFDLFQFHTFESGTIKTLLKTTVGYGRTYISRLMTVTFYAFSENRANFQSSLIKVIKTLSIEEQKSVLMDCSGISPDYQYQNILYCLMENPHGHYLKAQEYLKEIWNNEKIKEMLLEEPTWRFNILDGAIENQSLNNSESTLVRKAFEFLSQYLNTEELKRLLFGEKLDEGNCFFTAVRLGNEHAINEVFKIATEIFDEQELTELLKSQDESKQTLLNINLDSNENRFSLEALHANLSKFLSNDEILDMFIGTERRLSVAVDYILGRRYFEDIFSSISKLLSNDDVKKLIVQCLYKGELCFDVMEFMFEKCFEIFENEDFRIFISQKCGDGLLGNIFHFAAFYCGGKFFTQMIEKLSEIISEDEIKTMLVETNDYDKTVILYLIVRSEETHLENNFKILKNYFSNKELVEILIKPRKNGDNSVTHCLKDYSSKDIGKFFKITKREFDLELCRELYLTCDSNGNNVFHSAARNRRFGVFSVVFRGINDLKKDEIKNLFESFNNRNESVIFLAIKEVLSREELLEEITTIGEFLSTEKIQELLLVKSKDGRTCGELLQGYYLEIVNEALRTLGLCSEFN